ncbi:MAG: EpsG family protein, partial [Bacteroidales bacterium]|nr:EpsG family protein [Bacteroidales bacterium]
LLFIGGYFTHPTSMLAIFTYAIYLLRGKKILFVFVTLVGGILALGSMTFLSTLIELFDVEHFEMYIDEDGSGTGTIITFYLLLIVSCGIIGWKSFKDNEMRRMELGFLILACFLQTLSSISPSLFRLPYYYTPFFLTYIPCIFYNKEKPTLLKSIVKYAVWAGIIFFCLYTNRNFNYTFM